MSIAHFSGWNKKLCRTCFSVIALACIKISTWIFVSKLFRPLSNDNIKRKSFRLSVLSSGQLVKLILWKYACTQWISNLSYYWAWLMKLIFFSVFHVSLAKLPPFSPYSDSYRLFWKNLDLWNKSKFLSFYQNISSVFLWV